MSLTNPFSRRLYLRIWLAVVGGMAVLTLTVGWAWRIAEEQKAQNNQPFVPPSREMAVRDPAGNLVLRGMATRQPSEPGEVVEFHIEAENGQIFTLQMAPRQPRMGRTGGRPGGPGQDEAAFWTRLSPASCWPASAPSCAGARMVAARQPPPRCCALARWRSTATRAP